MAMAPSTITESDAHVAWLAAWLDLRRLYNQPDAPDDPAIGDRILELEDRLASAKPTTRAGVLAQIEVVLLIMERDLEVDRIEARILRNVKAALEAGI